MYSVFAAAKRDRCRDSPGIVQSKRRVSLSRDPPSNCHQAIGSIRQRVGPDLEVHDLALLALAAFDMRRGTARIGRENALALPTGAGIVDAPVHVLREEAHGV